MSEKPKRGFVAMTPEKQLEIARKGGAATVKAHGRDHMANIGSTGGSRSKRGPKK